MIYYLSLGLVALGVFATHSLLPTAALIVMVLFEANPALTVAVLIAVVFFGGWL